MKRAIIVHCWGGNPVYAWYPWVKQQLESKGYIVDVPQMPDTDNPQLSKWLPYLQKVVGNPDSELILIGHSIGCATIMRYLESLPENQTVGKVIFVAGFTDPLGYKELENFYLEPLNFEKIKSKSARGFVAIHSDNDPYVDPQYGNRLYAELGAKVIVKHNAGHMSGPVDNKKSVTELPELVNEVD